MTEPLKIGLDAKRIVRNGTGLGVYGRTLVSSLAQADGLDLHLYAPDAGRDDMRRQVAEAPNVHMHYPSRLRLLLGKSWWRSRGVVSQLADDGIRVYHGLSGEIPQGLASRGIKSVVTIHDLIFLRHPEYYKPIDVSIYRQKFRHAVAHADRIVAISECTRRDVSQLGGIDESRIELVYQSCSDRFVAEPTGQQMWKVRDAYHLPDRYVLSVGTIEERKNMLLAVKALGRLPDDVSLVLVGRSTPYADVISRYVDENRLNDRVMMLHNVPDADLPSLYRMADAFVYPSRYEGFGIPIVEAVRMRLPVVACTGSCLEEAGGPHNIYVDPDDVEAMSAALAQVLYGAPGRERRVEQSLDYVSRFTNVDVAERFSDIYHQLVP